MKASTAAADLPTIELPSTAPRLRITAGVGSAAQKTWNLRRPVTLIGSHRPAHIVLHGADISHAHCVVINTGTDVLLKDLHTRAGTLCNSSRADLMPLKDGDVITVGETTIQVAIQIPEDLSEDSGCGLELEDPTLFAAPLTVALLHTDQQWTLREAATMIGRHNAAPIWLDHEEVAHRHALIFRFKNRPAIFDLAGRGGVCVRGRECSLALLEDGDRVNVGPFGLQISYSGRKGKEAASGATAAGSGIAATAPSENLDLDPAAEVPELSSKLEALQGDISKSWEQLNAWQAQLDGETASLGKQESDLAARAAELDAKDAALRGRLHDVERFEEELAAREQELKARISKLNATTEKLRAAKEACSKRDAELKRRAEELARREHAVAQRWSRLFASKCPHCGRQIGPADGGAPPP